MIPLSLTIEGLYSYRQRQHIDFEKLSSNGLFGIFGQVGSGKSSILEAMMFVLFDDTERLNKSGDDRYYNMLNLQSQELYIELIFKAGQDAGKKYRAVCKVKRSNNPDKFEEVSVGKDGRRYYEWQQDGGTWMPLEGLKDATSLLSMEYKHFRQTVVIPQGRFRDFLDQTSGERTKMLKELFQLHQYDLAPQTGRLQKKAEMELEHLRGQLESLGGISEEKLLELQQQAQQADLQVSTLHHQHEKLYSREKHYETLRNQYAQIDAIAEELARQEKEEPQWQQRSQRLQTYQKAYTYFAERLRQQKEDGRNLAKKQEDLQKLEQQTKAAQTKLEQAQQHYQQTKEKYDKRDDIKASCEDLERILLIKQKEEDLGKKQQQLEKAQQQTAAAEVVVKSLEKELKATADQLLKLEETNLDATRLTEAQMWHRRCKELEQELKKEEDGCQELLKTLQGSTQNRRKLINGYEFLLPDHEWPLVFTKLTGRRQALEAQHQKLLRQKESLAVQQGLARFAQQLQDGGDCPLCGSASHPRPLQLQHMHEALKQCQEELEKHLQESRQMDELEKDLKQLQLEHQHQQKSYEQRQAQTAVLKSRYDAHQQGFSWPEFKEHGLETLEKLLQQAHAHQQKLKDARQLERSQRQKLEQQQRQCEQLRQATQAAEKEWERLQAQRSTLVSQLKEERMSWLKFDLQKVQQSLQKGRQQYQEATQGHENAHQEHQQVQQQHHQLQGELKAQQSQARELQQKSEQLQQELEALCREKGFISLEAIREILNLQLNAETEQEAIEGFYQRLHTNRNTLEHLKLQTNGQTYDASAHRQLQQELTAVEKALEQARKEKIGKEREADEMQKQLEKQAGLLKKVDALDERLQNLRELAYLFRSSGFVDYVSTMHLQDLCQAANERFFKLTNNSLSMELNAANNFIVRDHLNGGKTRLLKTLSGGQSFQAALCLALAMAENVKSLTGADQSFFFLDEGFGSLDKDSLRIVFDTLKSLRQENRIVGIISHVEELQQEIDLFLQVRNEEEQGSVVSCSWE